MLDRSKWKKVFWFFFSKKNILLLLPISAVAAPLYTPTGDLTVPRDYREWIFLSSGVDMAYTERAPMDGASMFDNVFVEPAAWQQFKATGHWPDRMMLVLENRAGAAHGSINKHGQFQTGEVMGLEVHVHDEARFSGGWGFFSFDGDHPAKLIAMTATCYACHLKNGAVQTTFTQFYPTAKAIAVAKGTYQDR